ncbi:MAG: hypothetical protein ABJZ80_08585, partial [Gilvibacter sp.]
GQEMDNEIKGEGNSLNYTFRMHDPRVGRFFATDPLERTYPFYSPYQFSGNRLIDMVELEGLEPGEPGSKEGERKEARTQGRFQAGNPLRMRTKGNPKKWWNWHAGTEYTDEGWYLDSDYELTQLDYENGQVLPSARWHQFGMRKINSEGGSPGSGEWYAEVDQDGYLTGKTGLNPTYFEMPWYVGGPKGSPKTLRSLAAAGKAANLFYRTRGLAYAFIKRIRLNLPRSQGPVRQWTVTDDILKKGWDAKTGFVYSSNPTFVGKFQLFKTKDGYRVIVKHVKDGDVHYHIGKAAENGKDVLLRTADEAAAWFQKNKYTRVDEVKHFYISPKKFD